MAAIVAGEGMATARRTERADTKVLKVALGGVRQKLQQLSCQCCLLDCRTTLKTKYDFHVAGPKSIVAACSAGLVWREALAPASVGTGTVGRADRVRDIAGEGPGSEVPVLSFGKVDSANASADG